MQFVCLFLLSLLVGCTKTPVFEREVDINKPYPPLQSVPERPEPRDYEQLRQERDALKQYHPQSLPDQKVS